MSDGEAMLAAIRENPADDTLRLVFADWLDENGDHYWAEYIRRTVNPTKTNANWRRAATGIMSWHWDQSALGGDRRRLTSCRLKRGFVEAIVLPAHKIPDIVRIVQIHPVEWLNVYDRQPGSEYGSSCVRLLSSVLPPCLRQAILVKTNATPKDVCRAVSKVVLEWCRSQPPQKLNWWLTKTQLVEHGPRRKEKV